MPSQKFLRDVTAIQCHFSDIKTKCKFYGIISTLEGKKTKLLGKFNPIYKIRLKDAKTRSYIRPQDYHYVFANDNGLNCSIIDQGDIGYNIHCIEEE